MSVRNLEHMFRPRSVAVVGASNTPNSVGRAVMRNLLTAGFAGAVMPVNPKYSAVAGVLAYPDVNRLPEQPDLAVVCTPPRTVPGIIADLGAGGTRAAIVLTAGLRQHKENGRTLEQAMLDAARPHLLRILGGNCLGILVPGLNLNASFSHIPALPGQVALIHQSGALCTALLDWATSSGIGFSHFVSIGDSADIDFGDVLDYLAGEPEARAILMYIEAISSARKFMSAARAAARNKPVIVIKAGRAREGAMAAASHTGAMMGADDVYDAAIRRAGMLRVFGTREMFDAAETLSANIRFDSSSLAIITNGGGPGVIATDELVLGGGTLAELGPQTIERLDGVLPATWSRRNPVDIIGDAGGERYGKAIEIVMEDAGVDTVLVLHSPTAVVSSDEAARGVIDAVAGARRKNRVIACWLGGNTVANARRMLTESGIPNYDTPDESVRAFLHIIRYRCNQQLLMETPADVPESFKPDTDTARAIVRRVLDQGRGSLSEAEAKAVLAAYNIPIVETRKALDPPEASRIAAEIGFPVALKILSPAISHKSDVGGVVLDLDSIGAVEHAARAMLERVLEFKPDIEPPAFTVQEMARRPGAYELICGAATDPVFGPVILFGEGGIAVEVIDDKSMALPPLNAKLALELIDATRVARRLQGYRHRPKANLDAIAMVLVSISQLISELPEVTELDINPLLADADGVLALDARISIAATGQRGEDRLAIRPYPVQLETRTRIADMDLEIRPIRPEDEPMHRAFLDALTPEDIRFRFFGMVRNFPHNQMARLTQIDYDREMAFIAVDTGRDETVGVVRTVCDPDNVNAEFAIIVGSKLKGKGLGRMLLSMMIDYCRGRGTRFVVGEVLADNERMIALARSLGFSVESDDGTGIHRLSLEL